MSTASLPSLVGPPNYPQQQQHGTTPAYTANPLHDEQRLLLHSRSTRSPIPEGSFTKASKTGSLSVQIYGQKPGVSVPIFGKGTMIHGRVSIQKRDTVSSVDVKLDGFLRLQEIGGHGRSSERILGQQLTIWSREESATCPANIDFTLPLRESYETEDGVRYMLPPTYEVHLSGLPGFKADVTYTLTVKVTKTKGSLFGNQTVVSTPFVYFPRTRPMQSIPTPPSPTTFLTNGGTVNPEWEVIETVIRSRSSHTDPIAIKIYIPGGRTFCPQNVIPFRLHVSSSPLSLGTFAPSAPTALSTTTGRLDGKKGTTRLFVLRQDSVDVRQVKALGTKTDIFKLTGIGEGNFHKLGDGPDWAAWEGEITIDRSLVRVGSFKASGLWVKDCIILSIIPPNPHNSPLHELRATIPIRLVMEPHASDVDFDPADWSDRDAKYEEQAE